MNRSHNVIADCVDELSELLRCWSAPSGEVMSIDQSYLKIMLENHVLKNKVLLGQLYNGQLLETIAGKFLRVFVYRTVGPYHYPLCLPPPPAYTLLYMSSNTLHPSLFFSSPITYLLHYDLNPALQSMTATPLP